MGKALTKNQKAIVREKEIRAGLKSLADAVGVTVTTGTLSDGYAVINCGEDAKAAADVRERILISGSLREFLNENRRWKAAPERATRLNAKGQKVSCLRLTFVF